MLNDNGKIIGKIIDIHRILDIDYLFLNTSNELIKDGFAKTFLVPYIPKYIIKSDIDAKIVYSQGAKEILEAS
jgi:16S rRNA processing protein RimM